MLSDFKNSLTWIEISRSALEHNVKTFRTLIGVNTQLCSVVKSNAYGHGLVEVAPILVEAGADWLAVNSLAEALTLHHSGVRVPLYIMGYILNGELELAIEKGFHFVVYNLETLQLVAKICSQLQKPAFTHLKLETGTFRQGILDHELEKFLAFYLQNPLVQLEGVVTHFANIEDTTDHTYANQQHQQFESSLQKIRAKGLDPKYLHCANSAATLLFPKTYYNLVRVGIGNYGMWPSPETYVSTQLLGSGVILKPALTWKTRIAQIKTVPAGSFIGYGCTYKTTSTSTLAVLPIGYYDNYSRLFSNTSYVLVHGQRSPVRGRIFMNMVVVDISDIPQARVEDEVVILGSQGEEAITAEQLATWSSTINYEVTTRINETIERKIVA